MVKDTAHQERVTGQDAVLKFSANGETYELPFENVSWSRDTESSSVQHNGTLKETKTTTAISFSGSFEYSGRNFDALNKLVYGAANIQDNRVVNESHEPVRGTLSVQETEYDDNNNKITYTYTFKNVMVTSTGRDYPSGDFASTSIDWEAEDMVIMKDGEKPSY